MAPRLQRHNGSTLMKYLKPRPAVDPKNPAVKNMYYLGLPLEVFLHSISYLATAQWMDLVLATHVCSTWRKAIIRHSPCWKVLEDVDPGSLYAMERVRVWSERAAGGLTKLELCLSLTAAEEGAVPFGINLRQILREIAKNQRGASLQTIVFDIGWLRCADDISTAFQTLVVLANFIEYSATKLQRLVIISIVPKLRLVSLFSSFTSLKTLVFFSRDESGNTAIPLPEFFSAELNQITFSPLQHLTLGGCTLVDTMFPTVT